jgi:uncharacterized protein (DUF736 family)
MSDQQAERKDIGAFWEKVSKSGQTYLSGQIHGQRVVVFRNKYKQDGDNKPTWRVYAEEVRQDGSETPAPVQPTRSAQAHERPVGADDIPF